MSQCHYGTVFSMKDTLNDNAKNFAKKYLGNTNNSLLLKSAPIIPWWAAC